MQYKTWMAGLFVMAALAACGDNDFERGLTGAAAGAVVAEATDNDPLVGAAVGGTAGVFSDDILGR
ncbi:hypothetical protein [Actibacterium sp. 188UL27-1]|uniref:hypothetical protein n=1 Tax=Actibacterium sp. 188UL27-1 TaxID=2786961 RepID=UPI00195CEE1C|nr:hypothetical protein [Actibacterium sp. 188UL27-1]MBM7069565.1 hypothetical protein [Actibacterium sp. 188UL27-1]